MTKDVSILLLDWGVRERFHTLDWLAQQTVSRDRYEIIWIELRDRVLDQVKSKVDHLITLKQNPDKLYHKHAGFNAGLLVASGRIITMCDSDAVYPPEFVASVIDSFKDGSRVLMHYQERSPRTYPDEACSSISEIKGHEFYTWPNVGACMSMLRRDVIGLGGLDEDETYRGLVCGFNELGWRAINVGIPEVWHESVHTYHFAHPGSDGKALHEVSPQSQHLEWHNLTGVDGFREGRVLPLVENKDIHRLRMKQRIIGTDLEKRFSVYHPEDSRAV